MQQLHGFPISQLPAATGNEKMENSDLRSPRRIAREVSNERARGFGIRKHAGRLNVSPGGKRSISRRIDEDCNKLTSVSRSARGLRGSEPLNRSRSDLNITSCRRYAGKVLVCVTGSRVIANVEAHHTSGHCLTGRVRTNAAVFPRAVGWSEDRRGWKPDEIATVLAQGYRIADGKGEGKCEEINTPNSHVAKRERQSRQPSVLLTLISLISRDNISQMRKIRSYAVHLTRCTLTFPSKRIWRFP